MTAILVREFGAPEVPKLEEIPTPPPAVGQALVRVKAAGVNPDETSMRMGTYAIKPRFPTRPAAPPPAPSNPSAQASRESKSGDRVYTANPLSGAYAEVALALESQLHPLPERIGEESGDADD